MLNIHGQILELLSTDEYFLLSVLLNYGKTSHPDNGVLKHKTGFGKDRLRKAKKGLTDKGILKISPRFQQIEGQTKRASNKYTITSNLVSKFNGLNSQRLEFQPVEIQPVETQPHEKQTNNISIETLQLLKSLNIEKDTLKEDKEKLNTQLSNEAQKNINLQKQIEQLKSENLKLTSQLKKQEAEKKEKSFAKKEKAPKQAPQYLDQLNRVLSHLTAKTNNTYRIPKQNSSIERYGPYKLIKRVLKEGFSVEDMKNVIDVKFSEWGNDNKMRKFLRPLTLFNINKFENYLNEYYLEQNKPLSNEQQTNSKTNRSQSSTSPEFKQAVSSVCKQYFASDGSDFLERWANQSNSKDALRAGY